MLVTNPNQTRAWELVIYKQFLLGFKTNSNTYHYQLDQDIDAAGHDAVRDFIVNAERALHVDYVGFSRVRLKQVAHAPNEGNVEKAFVTHDLGVQGLRPFVGVRQPPTEVLRFSRMAEANRNGVASYRGALLAADIVQDSAGQRRLANGAGGPGTFPAHIQTFMDAMSGNLPGGAEFIIMDNSDTSADRSRLVTAFGAPEIASKQLTNRRTSVAQAKMKATDREIRAIARGIEKQAARVENFWTAAEFVSIILAAALRIRALIAGLSPLEVAGLVLSTVARRLLGYGVPAAA